MNGDEIIILIILAVVVVGPHRLPQYAEQLAHLVRNAKQIATGATQSIREELGDDMADIDLSKFDPRQYDPRRIVRDALMDDVLPNKRSTTKRPARTAGTTSSTAGAAAGAADAMSALTPDGTGSDGVEGAVPVGATVAAPFDDEAT